MIHEKTAVMSCSSTLTICTSASLRQRAAAAGKLEAKIQATFPIEQIKQAVALAAAGERDGKILVEPNR